MRITHFIAGFIGLKKLDSAERKNAAEWGFLLSALFILPLFFMHDASELVKIGMQLMWGGCVTRSAFLANDIWKKHKQR